MNLKQAYGEAVRRLVEEVTDDKKLPKKVRKQLQVQHAPTASDAAKQLKIADKICNVRDVANSPPSEWSEERRAEYLEWADRVVTGCRGVNPRLDEVFDETIAMARKKLGVPGRTPISPGPLDGQPARN